MKLHSYLILFLLIGLFTNGCMTSYTATYEMSLDDVSRPAEAGEEFGEKEIVESDTTWQFEDEFIKTTWVPMGSTFFLEIENKTDHSISIVWDESVFISPSGSSKSLLHGEVRRIDANRSIPPTVVASQARSEMFVGTLDGFEGDGELPTSTIVQAANSEGKREFEKIVSENINEEVSVLLALNIEDVTHEYTFNFNIDGVEVSESGTY